MHHKLTKHGKFCKQNNQLPTKTHVELKDNSNTLKHLWPTLLLTLVKSGFHEFVAYSALQAYVNH
jgi:hypothetical protein